MHRHVVAFSVFAAFIVACGGKPSSTVVSIEISPPSAQLTVGQTQQFTAVARDGSGNPVANAAIAWSSTNSSVVSVTPSGVATAVASGQATIQATSNGISSSAGVTVSSSSGNTATLSLMLSGAGTGVVTSTPGGINCPTGCSATFPVGTSITLAAAANPGSTFAGWEGPCSGTGSCTVVLNSDTQVTATFGTSATTYTLSVTLTGSGTGTVTSSPAGISCSTGTCSGTFASGTVVTLTATPGSGSVVGAWSGACTGFSTCSIAMNADTTVGIDFDAEQTLTVNLAGSGLGTVTSTPAGINCVNGTCSAPFAQNSTVTLSANAGTASVFTGWSGACSGTGVCTVTMSQATTVTATFQLAHNLTVALSGNGTVTDDSGNIACGAGGACSASYLDGSTVTLTATPSSGSQFSGWGGACANATGNTCTLTISTDLFANATFSAAYTLSLTLAGAGAGSVAVSPGSLTCSTGTCTQTFPAGTAVTLTPTASSGSGFYGWTGGGCTGTGACTITLSQDTAVTATFQTTNNLTVGVSGSGTVVDNAGLIACTGAGGTCSGTYWTGSTITLTATPDSGQIFSAWGGVCAGVTGNSCTFTLSSDSAASAVFSPASTLNLTIGGTGSGSVSVSPGGATCSSGSCPEVFATGTSVTLTATAGSGSAFTGWTGVCASAGTGPCTFTLSQDTTVTATFQSVYALSVSVAGSGTVTSDSGGVSCSATGGSCSASYIQGTQVTLTPAPGSGYVFANWLGACSGNGSCVVTMNQAQSVTAVFNGPFDFSVSTPLSNATFSMVAGETRTGQVVVDLVNGAASPVSLSLSGLPNGVTYSFNPTPVTPTASSTLSITAAPNAALGQFSITVTGVSGSLVHTTGFTLEVRSPDVLAVPEGLAIEAGGSTALVTESGGGRLVRVDTRTKSVIQTLADQLTAPTGIAIESGGATALIGQTNAISRVDLSTGFVTPVSANVQGPMAIAIEGGGTTALVTDITTGQLDRVNLGSGAVTAIATNLVSPRGLAIESSGLTALVVEGGAHVGKVDRINLGNGGIQTLASGLDVNGWLALEGSGTSALVSLTDRIVRADFIHGTLSFSEFITAPTNSNASLRGMALEASGTTVLAVDRNLGRMLRFDVTWPNQTVAPSFKSLVVPTWLYGVSIEDGGTSAVVTDTINYATDGAGQLERVNLKNGQITAISSYAAQPLIYPRGVAVEPGGATALVAENAQFSGFPNGRLSRVDLATGQVTTVAPTLNNPSFTYAPNAVAVEASGATALVVDGRNLDRVDLTTGVVTTLLANGETCCPSFVSLSIEPGGSSVLVLDENGPALKRIDLNTFVMTTLATGFSPSTQYPPAASWGVAAEANGTSALVTEAGSSGRLMRVDLATGTITTLAAQLGDPQLLAIEATNTSALVVNQGEQGTQGLIRVNLSGTPEPGALAQTIGTPGVAVLEASGTTALMLDCGVYPAQCQGSGEVVRIDLSTGTRTAIVGGLYTPKGLAIDPSGNIFITDCGPTSCSAGRLLELNGGGLSAVVSPLNVPDAVAIDSTGATAYVAEQGTGRILAIDLTTTATFPVASGFTNPRQIYLESGGQTALVAEDDELARVNLSNGTTTPVLTSFHLQRFAIEPGQSTALVLGAPTVAGNSYSYADALYRLNLASSGLDVLTPAIFDSEFAIMLDSNGSNAYVTEQRPRDGELVVLPVPP